MIEKEEWTEVESPTQEDTPKVEFEVEEDKPVEAKTEVEAPSDTEEKEASPDDLDLGKTDHNIENKNDEISENDTSDNPDLDWLPDPDEVYGNQVENQSDMEETVKDKTNGIESKG